MATLDEWVNGRLADGTPLPPDKVKQYRKIHRNRGKPRPAGLGDSLESVLKRLHIHQWITGFLKKRGIGSCGCLSRKIWLNTAIPYDMSIWKERAGNLWRRCWKQDRQVSTGG